MLLYVDIIDACHLKCPTCVRGVRAFPNSGRKMPLETFRAILAKAKAEGAYRVGIFNWIEPFLCQDLHLYTAAVHEAGLPCSVSSTLSLRRIPHFEESLAHIDALTVSMSGFTQAVYEVNHRGGTVEWALANLRALAALKREGRIRTRTTIRFLRFDYNAGEVPALRDFAAAEGLEFEEMAAAGHPTTAPQPADMGGKIADRLAHFSQERPHEPRGKVCPLIFEHVTLNARGDVYQCCVYGNYDVLKVGAYLDLSREEILLRRYTQPVCNSCSWSRRDASADERRLLQQAMLARMGEPVVNRVPRLSGPWQPPGG